MKGVWESGGWWMLNMTGERDREREMSQKMFRNLNVAGGVYIVYM